MQWFMEVLAYPHQALAHVCHWCPHLIHWSSSTLFVFLSHVRLLHFVTEHLPQQCGRRSLGNIKHIIRLILGIKFDKSLFTEV